MEFPFEKCFVLEYQPFDLTNRYRRNTLISRQPDWVEPEFAFAIRRFDMDMWRFVALVRIKVKSIRTDTQNRWHGKIMPRFQALVNSL